MCCKNLARHLHPVQAQAQDMGLRKHDVAPMGLWLIDGRDPGWVCMMCMFHFHALGRKLQLHRAGTVSFPLNAASAARKTTDTYSIKSSQEESNKLAGQ